MQDFNSKIAVITGAASGIGRALALALARQGAQLALCDLDEAGLEETRKLTSGGAPKVSTHRVDVSDRAAVEQWARAVIDEHGRVNLLFNNAGVGLSSAIVDMSYEDLEWLMGINFWGVVHGTTSFLPHLIDSGDGHVINLSSVFGLIAVPGQAAYNAAKFAVRGYTECLREELEIMNVGVSATCVHPGGIKTNIARSARVEGETLGAVKREAANQRFDQLARTTPEEAAEQILRAVRRDARRVLVGPDAHVIDVLQRAMPTLYQKIVVSRHQEEQGKLS